MVCKNCGIANSDNSRFCSECGSALSVPKAVGEGEQAPVTENAAPVKAAEPQPVQAAQSVPPFTPASNIQVPYAPQPVSPAPPFFGTAPQPIAGPFVQAPANPPLGEQASAPVNAAPAQAPVQNVYSAQPVNPNPYVNQMPPAPQFPPVVQMPYGQMPMYPYPPMFKDPNASKITWALWLGILAAVIPLITISFGSPLALIMGIVAISLAGAYLNKVFPQNKNKAIAALVVGIIGTVFSLMGCSILLRAISTITRGGYLNEFYDYFDSFIAFWAPRVIRISAIAIKAVINQVQIIIRFLFLK